MKKTALKTKKSSSAARKTTRSTSHTASSRASKSIFDHYISQRNHFFMAHPNAQILLGLFIVATAIFIGVNMWSTMRVNEEIARMEAEAYYTY